MTAKKKTAPRAAEQDANAYESTRVPNLRYLRQVEARKNSTYAIATNRDGNPTTTDKEA